MAHFLTPVRLMTAVAAVLAVSTSLTIARAGDTSQAQSILSVQTLPGSVAQADPCGPKKISGPLGY